MFRLRQRNKGQSILEYAILLGVIIAALLIMQVFVKRGYQGGLKEAADKFGEQFSAGGTTVHQKRSMEGPQTITEEVATDSTINKFILPGMDTPKGTVAEGVYSYTARTAARQTGETESLTESAKLEKTRLNEYQADTVTDYTLSK